MKNKFFLFEENEESNELVVIFSGVNSKSFMGYKLIEDFDCNKIFIREEQKSWYHLPIKGVSKNIEEIICYIKTFTDKFKSENITFIGSSMGAYAALLIGTKLNIGKIIAFGPQIFINKNLPNNPKDDSYIEYKNLSFLINESMSNIEIFIGMNELCDLYHVKDINIRDNVTVYNIFGQPHNVMYFLNKINILKQYVHSKIFNDNYFINLSSDVVIDFNNNNYLEQAIRLFFIDNDYGKAKSIFEKLVNVYPSVNTFHKYCGICDFHNKNYKNAIKSFEIAKLISYRDDELHYFLGLSYFNQRNYTASVEYFKYAIAMSIDKKLSYYIKLSVSLRELKRYEEALDILNKSLKINLNNFGTYYQFAKIYKHLNDIDKVIQNLEIAHKLKPNNLFIKDELEEIKK